MTILYDRYAQLIIAPLSGGAGIELVGLRFNFNVKKTKTSEPNTATIKIYNLAQNTRDNIQAKNQGIVLSAGYRDYSERLFVGVIKRLEHKRDNTEIVTEMECKDGGIDLSRSVEFKKSYASGTSKLRIIKDILKAMPHVIEGKISSDATSGVIPGKLALSGGARIVLNKLARAWGFEWSVQNGALNILELGTGTITNQAMAIVLKPNTGLIGSPVKTDRGAKFQSLLIPDIVPGSYITLESEFLSGHYKAETVTHAGDTHGNEWTTDVEARSLN